MANTFTLQIPAALRAHAGGNNSLELSGGTVGELLGGLVGRYPELGKRLFRPDGELNRYVNVFVNDEDIRFLQKLQTPLNAGDGVTIVPAIAGG